MCRKMGGGVIVKSDQEATVYFWEIGKFYNSCFRNKLPKALIALTKVTSSSKSHIECQLNYFDL